MAAAPLMLSEITKHKIVPVVVVNDARQSDGLAESLVTGGLPIAEVTFRTAAAPEVIARMSRRDELLVGAGTVVTPEQVNQAVDCGARFIVSPGLLETVVERALELGVAVLPGAVTPSEIMAAKALGLEAVKFFPASSYGGAAAIKALAAPFVGMSFVPTGGVTADNVGEFLSLPCVSAVGGSWMVPAAKLDAGEFGEISSLVAAAVSAVASY